MTSPDDGPGRWDALTRRVLEGIETCDPLYRPTNFWQPGVHRLLDQMSAIGLPAFKTWPEAFFWFYPVYGQGLSPGSVRSLVAATRQRESEPVTKWVRAALRGVHEARRDYDVLRTAWDQSRWPFDLEGLGESDVGQPTQTYSLAPGPARFTRPYLNYLLGLAALSRHVTEPPPRSFLELGGGFGVLGEILLSRHDDARYVDIDIPPLLTVASYYLTQLFGDDRVLTYDQRIADTGPIEVSGSACLPSWRLPDLVGDYDVFWNSFSFQEMEPPVVANYLDRVAELGVRYVVSLNSRSGKPVGDVGEVGVREQVTSGTVIALLEDRGYELLATYNRPLIYSAGELAVLARR